MNTSPNTPSGIAAADLWPKINKKLAPHKPSAHHTESNGLESIPRTSLVTTRHLTTHRIDISKILNRPITRGKKRVPEFNIEVHSRK